MRHVGTRERSAEANMAGATNAEATIAFVDGTVDPAYQRQLAHQMENGELWSWLRSNPKQERKRQTISSCMTRRPGWKSCLFQRALNLGRCQWVTDLDLGRCNRMTVLGAEESCRGSDQIRRIQIRCRCH